MIEPEMAFADLRDNMANAEAFVKSVVGHVLEKCGEDLAFFEKFYDMTLLARLNTVSRPPCPCCVEAWAWLSSLLLLLMDSYSTPTPTPTVCRP